MFAQLAASAPVKSTLCIESINYCPTPLTGNICVDSQGFCAVVDKTAANISPLYQLDAFDWTVLIIYFGILFVLAIYATGSPTPNPLPLAQTTNALFWIVAALATGGAMAIAFSANLFSFFVAYQALTLAAFPLVAHRGDDEARLAGRTLLATLLGASMAFLLPAMVWTYSLAGTLEFQVGGVLAGRADLLPEPESAVLDIDLPANDERQDYLRATLTWRDGRMVARPFPTQDSSMVKPLAKADCLVIRAPYAPAAAAGSPCTVVKLGL